jgi:hypothetical protein
MIIDLRKQNRTIKIELESQGSDSVKIDKYIDGVLKDLEIVLSQRESPENLKIEITIN